MTGGLVDGTNSRLEPFSAVSKTGRDICACITMPRRSTQWTDAEELELVRLQQLGLSHDRMSVRLGRTKRAIQARLAELRQRQDASDRQEFRSLPDGTGQ